MARDDTSGTQTRALHLPVETDLDLLREYVTECQDHIEHAETALLTLETQPGDKEAVHTVFRAFHTIKGTSGFLGLDPIRDLAHLAENLLGRARDGQITITGGYADLALHACDMLKAMIRSLTGRRGGETVALPEEFAALQRALEKPEVEPEDETPAPAIPRLGDMLVAAGKISREQLEETLRRHPNLPVGEALVRAGVLTSADVAHVLRSQQQLGRRTDEQTVRVSTQRLDRLIDLVGELVITHSLVAGDPAAEALRLERLGKNLTQAGKIVRDLQDLTVALRMVPLRGTFQRVARITRDVSRRRGVPVRLQIEGAQTEIDRKMVEALNDPLVHLIRNAVDHGIEAPPERRRAGKPEAGLLALRAYHAGDDVVIEISDDGRGLDRARILAKARERGLIEAAHEPSDAEAFALIFEPGFSTARQVTEISGRGVGMDVVKRSIAALKGRIDVESRPGRGTRFRLRLPLTLALTEAMLVRVGAERFLVPTSVIERCFRPAPGTLHSVAGAGELVTADGEPFPLLRLHQCFDVSGAITDPAAATLLLVRVEGRRTVLMADAIVGQRQIVVRSLGRGLGRIRGICGASVLGDGRVALVLDTRDLLTEAHRAPAAVA